VSTNALDSIIPTVEPPIIPGFDLDPSTIRVGRDYFCTTSTFEYFPDAPIYHGTDLVDWTMIGHGFTINSRLLARFDVSPELTYKTKHRNISLTGKSRINSPIIQHVYTIAGPDFDNHLSVFNFLRLQ
jgi:beta-xylosidase